MCGSIRVILIEIRRGQNSKQQKCMVRCQNHYNAFFPFNTLQKGRSIHLQKSQFKKALVRSRKMCTRNSYKETFKCVLINLTQSKYNLHFCEIHLQGAIDIAGGGGTNVPYYNNKPSLFRRGRGSKMSKNMSTCFMDNPFVDNINGNSRNLMKFRDKSLA